MWHWLKRIGAKLGNGIKGLRSRLYESVKRAGPDDTQAWLEEKRETVALGDVYRGLEGNAGWQQQKEEFLELKGRIVHQLVKAVLDDKEPNEDMRRMRTTKMATEINLIDTYIGQPAAHIRDGEEARTELENFQKAGGEKRDTGG